MGVFLIVDSVLKLLAGEHPPIGMVELFDWQVWLGWLMIAALLWSAIPILIIGRIKTGLAAQLHDKVLNADAAMNRADWMTAGAALVGVIGIGFGVWWLDAAAAIVIGADIARDGWKYTRAAMADLLDGRPRRLDESGVHSLVPRGARGRRGAGLDRGRRRADARARARDQRQRPGGAADEERRAGPGRGRRRSASARSTGSCRTSWWPWCASSTTRPKTSSSVPGRVVRVPDDALLAAAGDLRRAYQEVDWAATPVGPAASWSPALRSALDLALNTRFPVTLFWGPEFVLLYNEAYVPVLAEKHPNALGRRAVDVFPEAWDTIGPWMQAVLDGEGAVWIEDAPVPLLRHGRLEESYFTFCYSPVRDVDGRVEGVIDIVAETTRNVIDQRRLAMLGRLREVLAGAQVVGDAFAAALGVLRENAGDMPAVDIVVGEPGFFGRDDLRLPLGEGGSCGSR